MAKRNPDNKSAERKALDAFDVKTKDVATLSAAQQEQRDKLHEAVKVSDFRRLAMIRGNRALKAIDGLAALARPNKYSYTAAQIATLKTAFSAALGECFARFEGKKTQAEGLSL